MSLRAPRGRTCSLFHASGACRGRYCDRQPPQKRMKTRAPGCKPGALAVQNGPFGRAKRALRLHNAGLWPRNASLLADARALRPTTWVFRPFGRATWAVQPRNAGPLAVHGGPFGHAKWVLLLFNASLSAAPSEPFGRHASLRPRNAGAAQKKRLFRIISHAKQSLCGNGSVNQTSSMTAISAPSPRRGPVRVMRT